ncbi:MAG: tyrosine-type recombinase/integrase [Hyphomicrobiaceae bacterium]
MPIITKRLLDAIKADGKLRIIRDDQLTGFGVQVTPTGGISFCITYTVGTKSLRRVIGRFGPMTVDQARKAALAHLATATTGEDPLADSHRHYATVAELFEAWMGRHVAVNLKPNTARAYRESFDKHCRARFGHIAPSKLDYATVREAHEALKATPVAANHMLRTLRAMLSWAADARLITWKAGNPARGHRLYKEKPSDRILSVAEIRAFITELPKAAMDENTRRMLLLELLLAQRSGEIAGMRKADVDLVAATWSFALNKSDRPHIVPLPPWSRELIEAAITDAKGPVVFPSPVGDPTAADATSVAAHALATALRRAQRNVDDKGKPLPRTKEDVWVFDFRDRNGHSHPISPHDLRRTCSSYLELLGFGDFVRGAILNHSQRRNVTAKHYSAAELLKLKRTALLQWEAALRLIMAGKDPFASVLEDDRAEEARVLAAVRPPEPTGTTST